jgi:rSAM/selenodomain-associated transferase 1
VTRGLIIFAREPVPGRVKTRLAASIGDLAAAEIYEKMLRDVLKISRQLKDVSIVVFWDCEEKSLPDLAEKYRCRSRRQSGAELGQRMRAAFEEMFANGYEACCIIGSDSPDLPLSYILEAYRLLAIQGPDVVVGPSRDGGYYLLGMRQICPELFTNIDWGTQQVLRQSLATAERLGIVAMLLPEWYDIDTHDDLEKFQARNRIKSGAL